MGKGLAAAAAKLETCAEFRDELGFYAKTWVKSF